jgi:signal transduction histidine kinase
LLGVPVKRLREKPLSEVMPIDADLMAQLGNEGEGQTDITLGEENSARQYTLTMTPLKGRYGELIGRLLLLHDITEEKRAQSRILKQQKVVAMLQERERLARELHDGIGQMLAAAQLHVKSASELLARGDKAMVESCLQRLAEVTQEAKESIRAYLLGVKAGSSSGGQGFVPFLSRYLDGFSRNYGIRAEIVASSELENKHIDPVVEIQLEPIVQEALTNVGRHSGADSVRVMLRSSDSRLQVKIEDNGRGFNPEETGKKQGFGLRSMQGRAEAVGGLLEVDSAPGRGTRVIVCVPWRKEGS